MTTPRSGRSPISIQVSRAAIDGMTPKSSDTAAAPACLMAAR